MERKKYDYSYYAYNKKSKPKGVLTKSLAATFVFAAVITVAVLVYLSLTIGRLTVIIEAQKCYALSFGGFSTTEKAESYAKIIANRGGAGYIVNSDNVFYVVACIYLENSDAQSVYKNLTEEGEDVSIIALETSLQNIELKCSVKEVETFHAGIASIKESFVLCNKLAADLDRGQDKNEVAVQLAESYDKLLEIKEKLSDEKFERITKLISKLLDNINKVVSNVSSSSLRFVAVSAFLSIGEI